MLLQVHDELIFDMEPSEEAQLHKLVSEGMIGALGATLPHRNRDRIGRKLARSALIVLNKEPTLPTY
jgi:DNA polymerase I-like protein with 3'-5' exonuclease and polymerase domains